MARLWIRVIKRHAIVQQSSVPCTWGEQVAVLREAVKDMDIPAPIWLNKHEREFSSFRSTAFLPDHFIEQVNFDRLEVEYLDDSGKKRESNDPRNQF